MLNVLVMSSQVCRSGEEGIKMCGIDKLWALLDWITEEQRGEHKYAEHDEGLIPKKHDHFLDDICCSQEFSGRMRKN